ncbi:uncharacterized protein LOC111449576 [Cucurbita moschata]|uniref:Uncharacterized protein LOC111449576 n=1 Tax=Cucurbita moschata TaxID=3662 RepID=A0A6J1G0I1_CUCMO|nr:uncharacterized protein LOC111449576 [Cucurbita moschata]XP_022945286.1 uncharacterized protein LOC111449576 [Cucurbita moschata]XP_022945287.1 uncharacterized protein LOC111449576 [Cucurbita moschata]XP_022945288.1 uncharacterized protein LOC111449576 [Cucurbita moschata]XP_022945289.1 uncharacterized protein LOC111449576 [Cucurbita moschata]
MSEKNIEEVKEKVIADILPQNQDHCEKFEEEIPGPDKKEENPMPSQQKEEEIIKKKYGGIVPKKPPLISKDHERAFFDSADWALGKQGGAQKPKGPLEALRPKLQPTPHQQVRSRRSAYAPADADDGEGHEGNIDPAAEKDQQPTLESGCNDHVSEEKACKE